MNGYLIDENVPSLLSISPNNPLIHCRELGQSLSDTFLWQHARSNALVIVTKDVDFSTRIMLSGPPPWVVHLRVGNMRRHEFHAFVARIWPDVEALLPAHKLINVYEDRIEAVS